MNKQFLIILSAVSSLFVLGNLMNANEHSHHHHNSSPKESTTDTYHHHHKTVIIEDGQPVPDVDLIVYEDAIKGWNLEIKLDNFQLTPQDVNSANQINKGHAHLFINGKKVTRLYGNWFYIDSLAAGSNEIKVNLNTNSHESLMYQGNIIEDIEIVEVK